MDDQEIVRHINELADEEHRLERTHAGTGLADEELSRLRAIEVSLDQCWDLLRQRRARRASGQDPDDAQVRPREWSRGTSSECFLRSSRPGIRRDPQRRRVRGLPSDRR